MFKIRCSAIGQIMAGEIGLTEAQMATLVKHQQRSDDFRNGVDKIKDLTDNMKKELDDLLAAQKNPQLPQTAKSYLQQYQKELIYSRKREITTKYTNKGLAVEDEAIEFAADYLGWGFAIKNEQRFEDGWMNGTPDVVLPDFVPDIKCSWDCFTFPLFETEVPNKDYYWQLQGYMNLTGKDSAKLVYVLMDTPYMLIEKQAYYTSRDMGYEDTEPDILAKCMQDMTYGEIAPEYRIKVFDVKRNDQDIQKIKDRVEMCREFLNQLNTKQNGINRKNLNGVAAS